MSKQNKIISSALAGAVILAAIVFSGSMVVTNDIVLTANYTTLTVSGQGTAADYIDVDGAGFTAQCLRVTGKYIRVHNLTVEGCASHGAQITGQYVILEDSIIRHNVTENGAGKCSGSGGWGSAVKVGQGSQFVTIRGNQIYENCGEGIGATKTGNVSIIGNTIYDNFSVDIYVDNSNDVTVDGNTTSYTGNSAYYRSGDVGSCIGMGIETYTGWTNRLNNITITNNSLTNCKGIGLWNEAGISPSNIVITGNSFTSVRLPWVKVPGMVTGTGVPITSATSTPRPTATRTASPMPLAVEECLYFPIHKQTICIK